MLSESITEAPIRMGNEGRRSCSRGIVVLLPLGPRRKHRDLASRQLDDAGLITPTCVIRVGGGSAVKAEQHRSV
jgi:hypothetical protein